MASHRDRISSLLARVHTERSHRHLTPGLMVRVEAIKRYQQVRFSTTYPDLLASPRYAQATRFFLDELYGPQDFSRRDAQFERVVPALVKLFPDEVVETVVELTELHALSEALDTRMGMQLAEGAVNVGARDYVAAWQGCGQAQERERQITLTIGLGHTLDRLTRKTMLRHSLRMMRGAARAAGLAELQQMLENGFDAFRAMGGAQEFLQTIADRERALAAAMFGVNIGGADMRDDASVRAAILGLA